ncbi:ABC transporter ATP-binding protein [Paenibacillus albiflavus]|uniref:ABC transporter ATP-binding protein n=1 Tax=Paenibacillus albiflavus TaxID=2545760 RepID=A0A4R4EGJ7_9BACL|nr:ABC transporter ATP-binding protein [Paenibacillus albiflavus]TCZ78270.1 ABC transporter ATP-binding protein [Paenibacillus albiflavus]
MKEAKVVLSVQNISKTYEMSGNRVAALKTVSFDLYQGEMLAIMGTSGSGKSTLLNILGALDKPNDGVISLNGTVSDNMFTEPHATIYRGDNIGFVFQSYHLLKDLSVEDNIALPLILKGEEEEEISNKVKGMMDIVGLSDWKNHRPVQLSGGQQQRVAIARAIITSPPIVLADEPTGNLDYNTSTDILGVLVNMKEKFAQSIIIVTHDPYVSTYADRVLFFHDGEIVDTYTCKKDASDMDNILRIFKQILDGAI